MEHRFCPTCGQPLPGRGVHPTIRMNRVQFDELKPLAVRTPVPPPLPKSHVGPLLVVLFMVIYAAIVFFAFAEH